MSRRLGPSQLIKQAKLIFHLRSPIPGPRYQVGRDGICFFSVNLAPTNCWGSKISNIKRAMEFSITEEVGAITFSLRTSGAGRLSIFWSERFLRKFHQKDLLSKGEESYRIRSDEILLTEWRRRRRRLNVSRVILQTLRSLHCDIFGKRFTSEKDVVMLSKLMLKARVYILLGIFVSARQSLWETLVTLYWELSEFCENLWRYLRRSTRC